MPITFCLFVLRLAKEQITSTDSSQRVNYFAVAEDETITAILETF